MLLTMVKTMWAVASPEFCVAGGGHRFGFVKRPNYTVPPRAALYTDEHALLH